MPASTAVGTGRVLVLGSTEVVVVDSVGEVLVDSVGVVVVSYTSQLTMLTAASKSCFGAW